MADLWDDEDRYWRKNYSTRAAAVTSLMAAATVTGMNPRAL
jgi:hypothetical protein